MPVFLLNLFLRFSGYTFNLKQKIVKADNWVMILPYTFLLIFSELGFIVISLPIYLLVPPKKVQEEGFIFPKTVKDKPKIETFLVRRKITLSTFFGAGGILVLKILVVGLISYLLFGYQKLLASTQNWTFDTPAEYIYDAAKIEVTGGVARLKDLGVSIASSTTNSALSTSSAGWVYTDWTQTGGTSASGSYVGSGGNPGGYVNIALTTSNNKNKTVSGYWTQRFVTSVSSPDTATLNLDWSSITFTAPQPLVAYKLYAFITTSATATAPVLGTEVWSSPTITGTTAWASITPINIAASIPTAGIYYLKIAAVVNTNVGTNATNNLITGFDNVIVNWTKTTHSYASDSPTVVPTSSLQMTKTVSWNSFSETATKPVGSEINYQLSSDNGTNWKYFTAGAWTTTTLATNYNTAAVVNTNISTFATSSNQIKWRAYLVGTGTQQVSLDNIAIGYTENLRPSVMSLAPIQNTAYGYVYANYNLVDTESDPSSLSTYEYSLTGAFAGEQVTMTASSSDPAHNGITSLSTAPAGVAHTFVWDAKSQLGNTYNANVYVRLRPNDGIGNGNYTTSTSFAVDYATSTVSNITASQSLGTTSVSIAYDLFDNTSDNILTELQISSDGGSTWTVPATSTTGAIGSGVSSGNGKTISWAAGTDYPSQQKSTMQIRIRAKDKFQNQGTYTSSTNFTLDTLPPATNTTANLLAQPNAGDTTVLIGGSFTELNPNTNDFYVAIDNGSYGTSTPGDTNTAAPANKNTDTGTALTGHDYISKVKIVHVDDYGLSFANENTPPTTAYKYVKPYTPPAPTLSNPITTNLDLLINQNASEASDLEYAILETTQNKYVQSNGTLGASPVWQVRGTGIGQWGNGLSITGKVHVTGLSSPLSQYIFKVKSRNPSDSLHAATSESAFSATASVPNTAPSIALSTYAQTTDGTQYTNINYDATDGQGDISNIVTYQYSTDNSTWNTMTEKSGAGSNGTSSLVFLPSTSPYKFVWDSGTNLPNTEDSTVYIRLKANDTQVDGNLATSAALEIDNKLPVASSVTASQNAGAKTVAINYTLTDANNSLVQVDISSDGGSTWSVATSTLSGAVGSGVTPGAKSVSWNAGTNFNGQYNTQMMVRVRARDSFGNQGVYASSSIFMVDTHAPVLSNITTTQDAGAKTFTFHYDVSEDIGTTTVALEISSNSGSTWVVPITTASGDIGSVTSGTNKTITWNAGTNYNNQEKTTMRIRLTGTDSFSNNSNLSSADFNLDSQAPRITNVSAVQNLATTSVVFNYDLADLNSTAIALDISSDNGSIWTVTNTSVSGAVGTTTAGTNKSIIWNAALDFPNQNLASMKVRLRGTDIFNNASANVESAAFNLDTLPPAVNNTADLFAQPLAGATAATISGSFTEAHPDTNSFYLAIDDGAYGAATAGSTNTASPANQSTAVGAVLDGNDYISKVKIVHVDDFSQSVTNENTNPNIAYKYVKPYTPAPPTVDNPGIGTVDVLVNKNAAETDGLQYAIYEASTTKFVQSDGTLGASPVWKTIGTGAGQWGQVSGVAGKINVNGLTTHSYLYQFQVKSRNTSDVLNAITSESSLSSGASSANQSPVITINSVSQTADGSKYVTIHYTGSDLESEAVSLVTYQYSNDNSTWHNMTEKSGVGSEGKTALAFTYPSTVHYYMWDVAVDLNNTEDSTVYVRLKANDGTSSGNTAEAAAFVVDTKNPVVTVTAASQAANSNNVSVVYNLSDLSNSTIDLEISGDAGSTWTIATSTLSGEIGDNKTPANGKNIIWNPGIDYPGQEVNNVQVRVKARDNFGNQGAYSTSSSFSVDTKSPAFSNILAAQNAGNNTFAITYDISDANNAVVALDISSDGGSTWIVPDTTLSGAIGTTSPGINKTITWNAGTDFSGYEINNMRVRLRATDVHDNSTGNVESANFSLDTKAPIITNVSAGQVLGTDNVGFSYDLSENGLAHVYIDISADNGSTWSVATSTLSGHIGAGVSAGSKSVSWNAATDYNNHQSATMKIRVRGTDSFNNMSANVVLPSTFSLDTLAPAINATTDLHAQPNAGDTAVLLSTSFTEVNPNTNSFLVAINGAAYYATTTGETNTANPADQSTAVGAILTGNDYITKVKAVHVDDYGHVGSNENTSPSSSYKYVKPYTPQAPTIDNPRNTSIDLTVNANIAESSAVEYAIFETSTGKYVQVNGTLSTGAVWETIGTGSGQWGNTSGISGKITVTGLNSPVANYSFKVKSRNVRDTAHAASSESAYSTAAAIINSAPSVNITSASQSLSGSYALINYNGTDAQNDTNNLAAYEYSINGTSWQAMTEKSGVGSDGVSGLMFSATSSAYTFAWDVAADLPNQEQATVYVRLTSSDTLVNSNQAVSSSFYTDTRGPVISNIIISQTPGSNIVNFEYDLNDSAGSGNNVSLAISDDNGSTYTVATSTLSGDISNVTAGSARTISWDSSVDFAGQESSAMKIRVRGTDRYGNTGSYLVSASFAVDAKTPVVSAISANQVVGSGNVLINYTLSDNTVAGHFVEFGISDNGGSTYAVATTTVSGNIGAGQTTGANSFTWAAGTDFAGHDLSTMKVRIRAKDYFNNQGAYASSTNFSVDTLAPLLSNITAAQTATSTSVTFHYDLNETATTTIDISSDGGSTWTVAKNSLAGNIGLVSSGTNKTVTWNAGSDFGNQENSLMRIRINGFDNFGNTSIYYESANFAVDTAAPLGLLSLTKFSGTATTATLTWQANTDANFNHYELWHGANITDVNNRNGSSTKWSIAQDSDLSNPLTVSTVITGLDLSNNYYVRIWAIDDFGNSISVPAINITNSLAISNVSASQVIGTNNVTINYDLLDSGNVQIMADISADSGATWTVATSSMTGNIGNGVTAGTKSIIWNAGVDYNNHQTNTMKVRVRGVDEANNSSGNILMAGVFSLDTLVPAISTAANLLAQPNAGDTAVLIGGSFTEVNPNTNNFYVAVAPSDYGVASVGDTNTATPATMNTNIGATLNGHDYISKVKLVHVDDYGHVINNENTSPLAAYKYVKPYTPSAPTVDNPQNTSVDVTINQNSNEASDVEYAIYESSTGKYVQSDSRLGNSAVWKTQGVASGEWGNLSGVFGKIQVIGLTSPVINYHFAVKSRNPSDTAHASSSESALSSSASSANQAPTITINSVAQTIDGNKYVTINYSGYDLESDVSSLVVYQYSTDNSVWHNMTEKSGVGSDGKTSLAFTNSGVAHDFMWDVNADLANTEDSSVYVRLKANDGAIDGNLETSSAFSIDTKNPLLAALSSSQTLNSNNVTINYSLTDSSNSYVGLQISADGGLTWNVASSTASGTLGNNVVAGALKNISWNPGVDYSGQEAANLKVRLNAIDAYGNDSNILSSANFSVDTKSPIITNVLAAQNATDNMVVVTYDINDANNSTVVLEISSNNGATWNVSNVSVSGAVGANVAAGNNKSITWDADTDFPAQNVSNMLIRLRATDTHNNVTGNVESDPFILKTAGDVQPPLVVVSVSSNAAPTITDIIKPIQPILTPLVTPTRTILTNISGLAEPRSKVVLYDNGNQFATLDSLADGNGLFSQNFYLSVGAHSLSVKSIDSSNNESSLSNSVNINIISSNPSLPIILSPKDNASIIEATPEIIGVSDPNNQIIIKIENYEFRTVSDNKGAWNFIIPSSSPLSNGAHVISVIAQDETGAQSLEAISRLNKIALTLPLPSVVSPATAPSITSPSGVPGTVPGQTSGPAVSGVTGPSANIISLPSAALISETTSATELPGIPVPKVVNTGAAITTNGDILSFSGTSLPNFDVVVYIHSNQALVYRTRTDANGNWRVNHSQAVSELTPGQHTIYAVALDANAKVKSRPSAVSSFMVQRNFWVMIFNYLNWKTTVATLIILILTIFWLYRLRKKDNNINNKKKRK